MNLLTRIGQYIVWLFAERPAHITMRGGHFPVEHDTYSRTTYGNWSEYKDDHEDKGGW